MSTTRFPSVAFTRLALIVGVPLAIILGVPAISSALTLKSWNAGDTLTAAELNANFKAIETELAPQPWISFTFGAGWTDQDTQYDGGSYRKMQNVVYLRGVLQCADWSATNLITTLPAEYRPTRRKVFGAMCKGGAVCRIDVLADGRVLAIAQTGTGYLSLDSISFPVN